jgi:hypothetical protein
MVAAAAIRRESQARASLPAIHHQADPTTIPTLSRNSRTSSAEAHDIKVVMEPSVIMITVLKSNTQIPNPTRVA